MPETPTTTSLVSNILGSSTASIIARLFTHPLDTAKARLQAGTSITANQHHYKGTLHVLQQSTLRGLYRGFGVVIYLGTPGTAIYLCSYDWVRDYLLRHYIADAAFLAHFTAGMVAETLACVVYVPVDVIKERMQVQQLPSLHQQQSQTTVIYRSTWDAIRKISQTEGLAGLYKGYAATLGSFGPFSAFYFMFYERFKHWARLCYRDPGHDDSLSDKTRVSDDEIPFGGLMLCSSSAAALASWVTSPLDMAKLRQTAGVQGLFRGAGARVLYTVPATTITMTCYERCRSFFANALAQQQ